MVGGSEGVVLRSSFEFEVGGVRVEEERLDMAFARRFSNGGGGCCGFALFGDCPFVAILVQYPLCWSLFRNKM
jgi:hypothetical protein